MGEPSFVMAASKLNDRPLVLLQFRWPVLQMPTQEACKVSLQPTLLFAIFFLNDSKKEGMFLWHGN